MSFINWGHETPEQKEIRRKMEERMMFEQMSYSAAVAAAAAAGSGKLPRTKQGQTTAYVYQSDSGRFYIGVMDFEKGSIPAIYDTTLITSNDWGWNETYIIQDKGYAIVFNKNGTDDKAIFFFTAGCDLIQKLELTTSDLGIYDAGEKFIVLTDNDANQLWWFDGLTVKTETVSDNISWNYEGYNLGGFFISVTTLTNYNIYFNDGLSLINILDIEIESGFNYDFHTYVNSNIFRIFKQRQLDSVYSNIYYYNNDGTIISDTDLIIGLYTAKFVDTYGTGKHVDTFYNNTEYFICYYDSVIDSLLTTVHDKTNYDVFIVTGQFINPGSQYDSISEHALIAFSNNLGYSGNIELYNVSYCDFLPLWEGLEDLDTIQTFADDDNTKYYNWERVFIAEDRMYAPMSTGDSKLSFASFYLGGYGTSPLIDFADYTTFESRLLGNRYMIDAWDDATDDQPGKYFITNKTGDSYLEYEYSIHNSNYLENERDLVMWRNSSDTDFTSYYLTEEDPTPFMLSEVAQLPPFGQVQSTSTYKTVDGLYPGNLLVHSGEGSRLYLFNDQGTDAINEGGQDMYDTGNYLNSDLATEIGYTHTQMGIGNPSFDNDLEATLDMFIMDGTIIDSDAEFGVDSQYFTNLYPGLFTMVAKGVDITEFYINGGTGVDDNGYNITDTYQLTVGSNQYTAFLKTTTGAGSDMSGNYSSNDKTTADPTINQIIIVDSISGTLNLEISDTTDIDYHKILGLDTASVTEVHYLLMATYNGAVQRGFSQSDFQNVVDTYLGIVDGKNISQTLTALNTNYATVTNEIANNDTYTLTLINNDGTKIEKASVFYDAGLDLGPTMCAGCYYNTDGFICVDVYGLNLELIATYISTETDLVTVRIIDHRLYVVTTYTDSDDFNHDVIAILKGTSFIKKDYKSVESWRSSNDYAAWY
ncbi:hypothetical protein UFOVP1247_121 [uncultured Caudovirales phage]|uniref:Uncharacterized protein n=1 Tax=uncultured Caudovirales phage TaxID=2100421 RepID=A0A6J5PYY2_9CAUD|nr:hypothetical protein UFOVP970_161 [uncultured Caudovirales phage]CAB4193672.1 hypothetical protein UFOVP1247_121 [uncultured Caudovirales phage]